MRERSYHVVEASEEGDVGEAHELRIVNAKTEETRIYMFATFLEYFACST